MFILNVLFLHKTITRLKVKIKTANLRSSQKKHIRSLRSKIKKKKIRRILHGLRADLRKNFILQQRQKKNYVFLTAPEILSVSSAPKDFVLFIKKFERIKENLKGKAVMFDLRNVQSLDFSGISLLIALRYNLQLHNLDFNGLNPYKQELCNLLNEYQFLQQLGIRSTYENIHFSLGKNNDKITIKGDSKVNPKLGMNIADYVSNKLFSEIGHYNDGLQTLFLELMANTTRWSNQENGVNLWLLTMAYNNINKKIEFIFIDFGVGVFESLKVSGNYANWYSTIGKIFKTNANIFESMLKGTSSIYKSSTGQYFRGKGIPSIKSNFDKNYYSDAQILTNNVFVDLVDESYLSLGESFNGTMVKWTVDVNNNFMDYNV